ncbi:2-succinylbenzoate--CoA ligase [Streptomyces violarus]
MLKADVAAERARPVLHPSEPFPAPSPVRLLPVRPVRPLRPNGVPFARELAAYGDRVALITPEGELSYGELAERVAGTAERLGSVRRLVLLAGANRVDALVTYLAALSAGHPVLLVPGDNESTIRSLTEAYAPDVVACPEADGTWTLTERHRTGVHALHPDLALLLSTSGSTGSPKLVRLSHENLQANAESIATYLGIDDTDRAATTLPMHYCYGLSVIHSHLLRGAGLILTERSVSEAAFWDEFRAGRGTSLAGVPYTFDLLDRIGFAHMELPRLRRVTQAGGRLAPERVAHYAESGRRSGWQLFVMYGQTEATARMAYLPPQLAAERPEAVGVPIPGGSFRLLPTDGHGPDVGELLYSGPNVMLGYAESPADLALGRTVEELRTGDLARRAPDGLYEIVGRRSRFAKILGLRIDPQRVESLLEEHGITAYCAGDGEALAVAALGRAGEQARIRRLVAEECGLPSRAVRVRVLDRLPRLATGKPDYEAVRRLTRPAQEAPPGTGQDLLDLYTEILDHTDVTEDSSFAGLGGDSLCYVEMSLRLEEALGRLPTDWHRATIRELRAMAAPAPERTEGQDERPSRSGPARRRTARGTALLDHPAFLADPPHSGDRHRPARRRDRPHRRLARPGLRDQGLRPHPHLRRRVQLRPLPADRRRTPRTAAAHGAQYRPHRDTEHGVDHRRGTPDGLLRPGQRGAAQQPARPGERPVRLGLLVRGGPGLLPRRPRRPPGRAAAGPAGAAVRVRRAAGPHGRRPGRPLRPAGPGVRPSPAEPHGGLLAVHPGVGGGASRNRTPTRAADGVAAAHPARPVPGPAPAHDPRDRRPGAADLGADPAQPQAAQRTRRRPGERFPSTST